MLLLLRHTTYDTTLMYKSVHCSFNAHKLKYQNNAKCISLLSSSEENM